LKGVFRGLPVLLRQHLCGPDHRDFQRAGRGRIAGRHGQKPEDLHRFRHSGKTIGVVRASGDTRDPLPLLESGHLSTIRELHPVAHRPQHHSTYAQCMMVT